MTNTLAKQSILNKDYILCHDGARLFIVGYGAITSGGKNTYNYEIKDNEKNVILSSGENAYLDALTKIILGSSPKAKANKEKSESEVNKPKESKKGNKDSLLLTFDEAFSKACNMITNYKEVAKMLGKYHEGDASTLALKLIDEARANEHARIKEAKKHEELQALRLSLDIAKQQGNNMLIDAINDMIAKKEEE